MNGQQKAEAELREIYAEAQGFFAGIHRKSDYGFKILNAPPIYQTPFLFIGYQPGGGLDDFNYETDRGSHLTWPHEPEYATASWRLAEVMREVFQPAINLELCVGMNAIFLRCPNMREYKRNLDVETREKVEQFCIERVHQIVEAIDPRKIVTIGFATLRLFGSAEPDLVNAQGRVLTRRGQIGNRPAIAVLHLSGARIANEDRVLIRDRIAVLTTTSST
jgi:hypothetical protein